MKILNRNTIDKYLFFKISDVNLSVSILDFETVINIDNPDNKYLIYKHKRYAINDLATFLKLDTSNKSAYGITRGKNIYLVYSVLSVGTPDKIVPFNSEITEKNLYKNYIFYKRDIYLQLDMEAL